MIQDRVKDSVRIVKLIVDRKPDKHSNRLSLFAQLHSKPGYQSLGFPEVVLTHDTYSDSGKFLARVMYSFPNVVISNYVWRGDVEEITFLCGTYQELPVSKGSGSAP